MGGSSVEIERPYELLTQPLPEAVMLPSSFAPNPDYERYLLLYKVLVGQAGARRLESMHQSLSQEDMPRYLAAAGWAAAEAAIVGTDRRTWQRLELLESGVACWQRALQRQRYLNEMGPEYLVEHSAPYRMALDIATTPLLRGIILGDVTSDVCRQVFVDCLNVAQANAVQLNLAIRNHDVVAIGDHLGFGYECNALLAFNSKLSPTWFALPAVNRADSGHHYDEQTHDISIVHQTWGVIRSVLPVEIKSAASLRDRQRYQALLVRGKMHLSVPGKYSPEDTLAAITAVYEGRATLEDMTICEQVGGRLIRMVKDYYAGEQLGRVAAGRTPTTFRDNSVVASRHPGLSRMPHSKAA